MDTNKWILHTDGNITLYHRDYVMAKKIIDLDVFSARDNDLTPEKLADELQDIEMCKETINFLLDFIDDLL